MAALLFVYKFRSLQLHDLCLSILFSIGLGTAEVRIMYTGPANTLHQTDPVGQLDTVRLAGICCQSHVLVLGKF